MKNDFLSAPNICIENTCSVFWKSCFRFARFAHSCRFGCQISPRWLLLLLLLLRCNSTAAAVASKCTFPHFPNCTFHDLHISPLPHFSIIYTFAPTSGYWSSTQKPPHLHFPPSTLNSRTPLWYLEKQQSWLL